MPTQPPYVMDTEGFLLGGKAAGAWSYLLTTA
jgi:hypothetical protein